MDIIKLVTRLDLEEVQEASWTTILIFLIVEILFLIVVNLVLFPARIFRPISNILSFIQG